MVENKTNDELESNVTHFKNQVDSLKKEIKDLEDKVEELEDIVDELNKDILDFEDKVEELEGLKNEDDNLLHSEWKKGVFNEFKDSYTYFEFDFLMKNGRKFLNENIGNFWHS